MVIDSQLIIDCQPGLKFRDDYFAHEYIKDKNEWTLLALIQWVTTPVASGYGPVIFRNLGHSEIINVNAITRSISFFSISKNRNYIIDREDHVIHTDK